MSNLKKRKSFSLTPVIIYLDDIREIFDLLNEYFNERDLKIESDGYIYKNFDELVESFEDNIRALKIAEKNDIFSIYFNSSVEIKFKNEDLYGLAFKIFYILRKKKIKFQTFLHHFYNYYILITLGIYFGYIYYFKDLVYSPTTSTKIVNGPLISFILFFLILILVTIFSFVKKEKLAYSKIILHWKNEDLSKIKYKKDFSKILEWIKLLIPPAISFIFGFLLKLYFN